MAAIYLIDTHHLADWEQLLLKACIAGDRTAQMKLYTHFAPKMLPVCLRYARNREEAEEILQDGFMRVFSYIKKFKGMGSLEGWIRKIMVNCALSRYNKKISLTPVVELNTENIHITDETDIVSNINAKELLRQIQSLTPAYRLVFNLYVFEGMKHREIAALLGISEGTSKSNLADARIMLQKALKKSENVIVHKS